MLCMIEIREINEINNSWQKNCIHIIICSSNISHISNISSFQFGKQIPSESYRSKACRCGSGVASLAHCKKIHGSPGWVPRKMRPSSIHRPSAQGGSNPRRGRSDASLASRARAAGSDRGRQGAESREVSWGNISENKGIGTSVSMVIPSSGGSWDAGRENALRACSLSAPRRNAPGRAGGQETPPPRTPRKRCPNRRDGRNGMKWETNSIFSKEWVATRRGDDKVSPINENSSWFIEWISLTSANNTRLCFFHEK